MKRKIALEIIRIEWAKYGKDTRESMRAYIENRISRQARNEAASARLRELIKVTPPKRGI
ncbi:unnamed protein product [marine sediment metagenome]|uniref:Uncharacterized protein n=1 Tax=marine sediment metagenome TaxID=412755 RepID=X0VUA0_9ZZZZ